MERFAAWVGEVTGSSKSSWLRSLQNLIVPEARAVDLGTVIGVVLIAAAAIGAGILIHKYIRPKVKKALSKGKEKIKEGAGKVIDKAKDAVNPPQ